MNDDQEIVIMAEKLDQMMALFYLSLPHDEAEVKGWTISGMQFKTLFENVFSTIKANFKRNPQAMLPYMVLLRDCIDYVIDDRDSWPDQDNRDNDQAILHYLQQKRYTKHPEKNPVNLIVKDNKIIGVINDAYFNLPSKK